MTNDRSQVSFPSGILTRSNTRDTYWLVMSLENVIKIRSKDERCAAFHTSAFSKFLLALASCWYRWIECWWGISMCL